jgi:hypothetical protein
VGRKGAALNQMSEGFNPRIDRAGGGRKANVAALVLSNGGDKSEDAFIGAGVVVVIILVGFAGSMHRATSLVGFCDGVGEEGFLC